MKATPINAALGVDGEPFNFESVAYQLAGALSNAMLPPDQEMPSEAIRDVIDRFVYQWTDEPETLSTHAARSVRKLRARAIV